MYADSSALDARSLRGGSWPPTASQKLLFSFIRGELLLKLLLLTVLVIRLNIAPLEAPLRLFVIRGVLLLLLLLLLVLLRLICVSKARVLLLLLLLLLALSLL